MLNYSSLPRCGLQLQTFSNCLSRKTFIFPLRWLILDDSSERKSQNKITSLQYYHALLRSVWGFVERSFGLHYCQTEKRVCNLNSVEKLSKTSRGGCCAVHVFCLAVNTPHSRLHRCTRLLFKAKVIQWRHCQQPNCLALIGRPCKLGGPFVLLTTRFLWYHIYILNPDLAVKKQEPGSDPYNTLTVEPYYLCARCLPEWAPIFSVPQLIWRCAELRRNIIVAALCFEKASDICA